MALIFSDSFDHATTDARLRDKWSASTAGFARDATGRTGACIKEGWSSPSYLRHNYASNKTTIIIGFAIKVNSTSQDKYFLQVLDGTTVQIGVKQNSDGTLSVVNGSGSVLASTSSGAELTNSEFRYIEFKTTIDNSTGSFELKKNGVTLLSGSNVDTQNTANAYTTGFQFAWETATATYAFFDDVYVCDTSGSTNNDFLGAVKIEYLAPGGAGATANWTPSAGSNYACVDETDPNDDTDYVASATVGVTDTYAIANSAASTSASVKGVMLQMRAKKDDANPRAVTGVLRPSSTDRAHGTPATMTTSYAVYLFPYDTDPDDSSAWTITKVNALEAGQKVTT